MDDAGVVGLVHAYEHSLEAGISVAMREPRLINERTSLGETALHLLVLSESNSAISSILELGAQVNVVCHMGETPLCFAASHGQAETVKILLGAGAALRVDGQLEPTLHKATRGGNVEVARLLIDAGANVNEQADFAEAPIHIAAEEGHSEMIKLLLARGADSQLKSTFGGTALEVAQAAGKEACVALLASRH